MKIRVVTSVYNEEKLLPHFIRHYESFCDEIVIWDNGSSDRTAEIAWASKIVDLREYHTEGFNEGAKVAVFEETRKESRGRYDWLLIADCDEFVIRRHEISEREILNQAPGEVVIAKGVCLVQVADDLELDLSQDILPQRRHGYYDTAYSKPVLVRPTASVTLQAGNHSVVTQPGAVQVLEPRLLLIHSELIDWGLYVYRKNRRQLSEENRKNGWSVKRFCRPVQELKKIWDDRVAKSINLDDELPRNLAT